MSTSKFDVFIRGPSISDVSGLAEKAPYLAFLRAIIPSLPLIGALLPASEPSSPQAETSEMEGLLMNTSNFDVFIRGPSISDVSGLAEKAPYLAFLRAIIPSLPLIGALLPASEPSSPQAETSEMEGLLMNTSKFDVFIRGPPFQMFCSGAQNI